MKVPKTAKEARQLALREVAKHSRYTSLQHRRAAIEERRIADLLSAQVARLKPGSKQAGELVREASTRRLVATAHEQAAATPGVTREAAAALRAATREVKAARLAVERAAQARPTVATKPQIAAYQKLAARNVIESARLPVAAAREARALMGGVKRDTAKGVGKWMKAQDPKEVMDAGMLAALQRDLRGVAGRRLVYPWEQHVRNGLNDTLAKYVERTSSTAATHAFEEARFFDRVLQGPAVRLPTSKTIEEAVGESLAERLDGAVTRTVERISLDLKNRLASAVVDDEPIESMVSRIGGAEARALLDADELEAAGEVVGERLVEMAESQVERMVKTEVGNAYNTAKGEAIDEIAEKNEEEYVTLKRWDATLDNVTCEECAALHEVTIELDEMFNGEDGDIDQPPLHPYCYPGDAVVAGRVEAGLRMLYAGKVVDVETAGGVRLTVTPNHRVLTPHGFVPAHTLREGMKLLCQPREVGLAAPQGDEHQAPARAADVFRALGVSGPSLLAATAVDDLHGDARWGDGKVEVVGVTRDLLAHRQAKGAKRVGKLFLELALVAKPAHSGLGAGEFGGESVHASAACLPCRPTLAANVRGTRSDAGPLENLRLGAVSQVDVTLVEPAGESPTADATFLAELQQRFPGCVAVDEIVKICERDFRGHVYDLQSPLGWIVAQGVYVSNCRCDLTVWMEAKPKEGEDAAGESESEAE